MGEPRRPFFVAERFYGTRLRRLMSILLRFVQLPSFSSFFFFSFLSFFVVSSSGVRLGPFSIYVYVCLFVSFRVRRMIMHVGKFSEHANYL